MEGWADSSSARNDIDVLLKGNIFVAIRAWDSAPIGSKIGCVSFEIPVVLVRCP